MKLKIYFTYDGTYYSGWQRQKNTPNTIQEILENRCSQLSNSRISLVASGRTDAGVHARVQVAHATFPESITRLLPPNLQTGGVDDTRFKQSLNSLLPPDIRVLLIEKVPDTFHANQDVIKKTYVYFVDPSPLQLPELRNYTWHLRLPLDWDAMEKASESLLGEHDFKAFCGADSSVKSTVRMIYEAQWGVVRWNGISGSSDLRVFRITGTGFLKHMVRSIVGTLAHIGNGKSNVDVIDRAIQTQNRQIIGPTAPARGLWLWDILYLS